MNQRIDFICCYERPVFIRKKLRHYTTTFAKKMKYGIPRESGSSVACRFGADLEHRVSSKAGKIAKLY